MDGHETSAWRKRPAPAPPLPRRWVSHARHDAQAPHAQAVGVAPRPSTSSQQRETPPVSPPPPSSPKLIKLDGATGEGGGQILRTALSLSLLTGRPFRIVRIRANREKPGLRPQHLKAVEAAALLCGGAVTGGAIGSRELTFHPAPYTPADLRVDVGTAGATTLILHALALPIALRAEAAVRLTLTGGTFNLAAPSYPFLRETWRRHMAALGLPIALSSPLAGFYPKGGGQLDAWIEPGTPRALTLLDRPPLVRIRGEAGTANLRHHDIAHRMRDRVLVRLAARGLDAEIGLADWPSPGVGAAIALTAEHGDTASTFVGLGERGKPAEAVADEAVDELLAFEDAAGAVDPHSADQLLLPLAMAEGRSVYTVAAVTEHLRTNIQTIRAFLDRPIRIDEPEGAPPRVVVG